MNNGVTQEPIVIVGAGPAGLVCALLLVRAGFPVTVLEREQGLPEDMRASTFHPATLDLLAPSGITRTLLNEGTRVPVWQYLKHATGERIVFDLGLLADVTDHPYRLQCEQFRLTAAIMRQLRDDPLFTLHRGARLTDLQPDQDSVSFRYDYLGDTMHDRCRWLIAADGGRSSVRRSLGLTFDGSVFPQTSITAVLNFPFEEHVDNLLGVNYVWTDSAHYSLMKVRDLWRFSFSPDNETDPASVTMDAARKRIGTVFPAAVSCDILQLNHYTLHQRCLDRFTHGRVLFCGDSAHLNSPAGGMGMNSGVHDAVSLVRHLLPVFSGEPETLLDRYDRRRRTIAREEVQRLSARNYRRHRETDPQRREAVWDNLRSTAEAPDKARQFLLESSMIDSLEREARIS